MNVYEMEGFLRGKCMPRDILVNESTAAYLVRKLNESATLKADRDSQQKRADALADKLARLEHNLGNALIGEQETIRRADALAVENAGLKAISIKLFNLGYLHGHESTVEGYFVDVHRNDIDTYHDDVVAEILEDEDETPATSVALAAIEARGVEKLAAYLWKRGNEIVSEGGKKLEVIQVRVAAKMAEMFANELREGK